MSKLILTCPEHFIKAMRHLSLFKTSYPECEGPYLAGIYELNSGEEVKVFSLPHEKEIRFHKVPDDSDIPECYKKYMDIVPKQLLEELDEG